MEWLLTHEVARLKLHCVSNVMLYIVQNHPMKHLSLMGL